MTTVVSGLHPLVTSALEAHGCGTLTSVQHQTLSRATVGGGTVPPDCIVETPRGSGHNLCMVAYAAHFVHSQTGGNQPFAVIVARDQSSLARIMSVSGVAAIPAVRFVDAAHVDPQTRLGSSVFPLSSRVIVGTQAMLSKLAFTNAADARASCVSLIIEEAAPTSAAASYSGGGLSAAMQLQNSNNSSSGNKKSGSGGSSAAQHQSDAETALLAEFVSDINGLWPNVNLCLMSSRPPSAVHASLRYLLRRNNRCYLPARSAVPVFSTVLCLSAEDRTALCHRVTQISGLRRVLILTHNREVRDLKLELHKALGLRTFAIQRATPQEERERVLTDFLECDYGVLVAMDAFTGVDIMDVDGVVQYYPPQKSMTDDEWADYVSFLRTTGDSSSSSSASSGQQHAQQVVVTLAGTDDLSMIKHLQSRVGFSGAVLNLSPNHVNFEDFVLQPNLAVLAKLPSHEEQEAVAGTASINATRRQYDIQRVGAGGGAACAGALATPASQQQQQQRGGQGKATHQQQRGRQQAHRDVVADDAVVSAAQPRSAAGGNNRLAIPVPSSSGGAAASLIPAPSSAQHQRRNNNQQQQQGDNNAASVSSSELPPPPRYSKNPQQHNNNSNRRQQQQQNKQAAPADDDAGRGGNDAAAAGEADAGGQRQRPSGKRQHNNNNNNRNNNANKEKDTSAGAGEQQPQQQRRQHNNQNRNRNAGGAKQQQKQQE